MAVRADDQQMDNAFMASVMRRDAEAAAKEKEIEALKIWWNEQSNALFSTYLRKAREYGSVDLDIMGSAMRDMGTAVGPMGGVQMAIMFYALGKVSRAISALKAGGRPSDDTLQDLVIYTMMAMIISRDGSLPDVRC